jgi:hypothetical protein
MPKRKNFTRKRRKRSHKTLKGNRYRAYIGGGNPLDLVKSYISHVVYVNLDSRTDRRSQIEKELGVFNREQIHRIPGIVPDILDIAHKNVALAKAHLNGVKLARDNKWKNTLFLEDDSVWANVDKAVPCLEKLVNKPYDVIMLGAHHVDYDKETLRIKRATSGASYLLHNSYYNTYIERLESMINSFISGVTKHEDVQTDTIVFGPLQEEHRWFIVIPPLMIQNPGYSDRVGEHIDFSHVEAKNLR